MIDQEVRREIVSLLRSLAVHEQRALLMVTHDIVISVGICERLLVMEQGRVVGEGRTEEILKAPKADLTRRLTLASQDIRAYWDAKSL
jgi:ABC-type glutathione transport system ATPase component